MGGKTAVVELTRVRLTRGLDRGGPDRGAARVIIPWCTPTRRGNLIEAAVPCVSADTWGVVLTLPLAAAVFGVPT